MTATTATATKIRCGHCRDYHPSIAAVRECGRSRRPATVAPAPAPAQRFEPATDGMYLRDGVIYKVQVAVHGSGNLYAKQLVREGDRWAFVFAPGMIRKLHSGHRMTLEQAKEFGALYGTCCVCGRTLTNEDSIAAGIGPVCAGKEF